MSIAKRHAIYRAYLDMKVAERDWHGVMDAAADLRELEASHPVLRRPTSPDMTISDRPRKSSHHGR